MGKRRYKLGLKIAAEQADIAKAAKKRGLWSTRGSTLGAALAIAVTGGAAAPLVAGAIAAGASYAGGHLGNYAAGKSGGKLKGKGRFFSAERASLAQGVKDKIGQTAVKTGLQVAGMKIAGKLGGKIKLGKGPASVELQLGPGGEAAKVAGVGTETAKGSLWDTMFKSSDPKALAGQKGFGKLIDFQGSAMGKQLSAAKSAKLAKEFGEAGWIDPNLQSATSEFTDVFPKGGDKPIVAIARDPSQRLLTTQRGAQVDEMLSGRAPLPRIFEPSMDEMMERKINMKGPGFEVSDQVFPDPTGRSSVQQAAFREAKAGPQITDMELIKSDMPDYLQGIEKVGPSKFAGASEAQAEAVMAGEVPEWYGAPKGTTWGETAIDPGRSDISYAGDYATSPDEVPYTGDVPNLMDMYQDELAGRGPGRGMPVELGSRDYWPDGSGAGDIPIDIDQPGPISADMTQFPDKQTLLQQAQGPGSFLPEGPGPHMTAIREQRDVINQLQGEPFQAIDPLQGMQRRLDQSIMDEIVVPGRRSPTFPIGAGGPNDFIDFEDVPRKPWQKRIFG